MYDGSSQVGRDSLRAELSASRGRLAGVSDARAAAYFQAFPALTGIYLEDSWILDIVVGDRELQFRLEAVLTPDHADYTPPLPAEQHCYRAGVLTIRSSNPITLHSSGMAPATDATGERDYGHIDSFVRGAHDSWQLEGDWGSASILNPVVLLDLS